MRLIRQLSLGAIGTLALVGTATGTATATASTATTASTASTAGAGSGAGSGRWDAPDPSIHASPDQVLGARAGRAATSTIRPLRIVSLVDGGGRPLVRVVTAVGRTAARAAVRAAQHIPGAIAVAVAGPVHATGAVYGSGTAGADPMRAQQWALDALHAEQVWSHSTGSGVTVAVIDSGVARVADLAAALLPGVDYVDPGGDGTAHACDHGTHVAGIIAAAADNGIGVAGLAPGARILPIRVLDGTCSGDDAAIAQGLVYAASHGASVINLSLGGEGDDPVLAHAIAYVQSHQILVVAAVGNERDEGDPTEYPAAYPGVLGVAATTRDGGSAYFSNTGVDVDVAAPGVDILSTVPDGYDPMNGTSMATPYVSASAAVVLSADPTLTPGQAGTLLGDSARDLGAPGRDDEFGAGQVDPLTAVVALDSTPRRVRTATRLLVGSSTVPYGQHVVATARLTAGSGTALGHAQLLWCVHTIGVAGTRCGAGATSATGTSTNTFVATSRVIVYATYPRTATEWASTSLPVRITTVAKVVLRPGASALAVAVAPSDTQRIRLDRWTGRAWKEVTMVLANRHGNAAFGNLVPGSRYRIRVSATAAVSGVTSATVLLR